MHVRGAMALFIIGEPATRLRVPTEFEPCRNCRDGTRCGSPPCPTERQPS